MTKTMLAAVGLTLMAGTAMAGEGNGNPFPYRGAPISTTLNDYRAAASKIQDPFPFATPGASQQSETMIPGNGSDGAVQTANSMPAGAMTAPADTAVVNRNAAPAVVAMPSTTTQPRG